MLGSDFDQATFGGPTDYKIMFGPDICGYDVARIHLIFNWKGKNLLRSPDIALEYDDKNEYSHLYTLVMKPDNTYKVYFDLKEKASGNLHDNWDFPNRTHDDPKDAKPADWVETKKIDDPAQKKPDDWVDEQRIRDPSAEKPPEWDDDEDGGWEAPMIDNTAYKGAWFVQQVDNPAYKGEWKAMQLDNPEFVEEVYSYDDIGAAGFELWTVNAGSVFDNVFIGDSFDEAKKVGEELIPIFGKEKDAKKAWEKATGKDTSKEDTGKDITDDEDDEGVEGKTTNEKSDL